MNPPSDPWQLLVYGVGTVFVVFALKLWDRRRDGKLQRGVASAVAHAEVAATSASAAEAAVGRVEEHAASRAANAATAQQAGKLTEKVDDGNALLLRVLSELGEIRGQMRRLEPLPERMAVIEHELDALVLSGPVRRRQEPRP